MAVNYHQNKTYKIYPLFSHSFSSCLSILQRDRFTDILIKKVFNYEQIPPLSTISKSEFLEDIINDIKSVPSIMDLHFLYDHPRMNVLKKLLAEQEIVWNSSRIPFNARIHPDTIQTITELAVGTETIGEVIELAIANYIRKMDEAHFELIRFIFEYEDFKR